MFKLLPKSQVFKQVHSLIHFQSLYFRQIYRILYIWYYNLFSHQKLMDHTTKKLINTNSIPPKKPLLFEPLQNYTQKYKTQIYKWIKTLDQIQRASVMTIRESKKLHYITNMMIKSNYEKASYCLIQKQNKIYDKGCCHKYKPKGLYTIEQILNSQKQILQNIVSMKDSLELTFKRSFMQKVEVLLEHMSIMTNGLIFSYLSMEGSSAVNSWFVVAEGHSFCQWLIYAFETEIFNHYIRMKEVEPYSSLQRYYNIQDYIFPNVKADYFTIEKIRKLYKENQLQNSQQTRKNRQLNIQKILELSLQKTSQDLVDDIVFHKLIRKQDSCYFIYLDTVFELAQQSYSEHKMAELFRLQQNTSDKPKNNKKRKNKKKKKKNKNSKNMQQEASDVDNDEVDQQSAVDINVLSQQNQQINEICTKNQNVTQENLQFQDTINFEQQKQQIQIQDIEKQEKLLKKKKKPAKKVNNFISSCLKQYIDQFSESSNRLISHRKLVFNRLEKTVLRIMEEEKIYFNFSLKVFGSCALGLSTYESDIDMVLLLDTSQNLDSYILQIVHKKLEKQKWILNSKFINSSVPLIKFEVDLLVEYSIDTKQYNIQKDALKKEAPKFQVDLSIQTKNSQNHQGLKTTQYALSLLSKHHTLRNITLLLKILIKARGLNLTFRGGVNSYVLFLMVYTFLKNFDMLESGQLFNPLKRLLQYYFSQFNMQSTILDPRLDKPLNSNNIPILDRLTIMDPLSQKDKYINTNSSQINKIFQLFRQIHSMLMQFKDVVDWCENLNNKERSNMYFIFKSKLNELMSKVFN